MRPTSGEACLNESLPEAIDALDFEAVEATSSNSFVLFKVAPDFLGKLQVAGPSPRRSLFSCMQKFLACLP
jgi:hypothetical protein